MMQNPQTFENPDEGEFVLTDVLIILRRRSWVILATTVILLIVGIFFALKPRKYAAQEN